MVVLVVAYRRERELSSGVFMRRRRTQRGSIGLLKWHGLCSCLGREGEVEASEASLTPGPSGLMCGARGIRGRNKTLRRVAEPDKRETGSGSQPEWGGTDEVAIKNRDDRPYWRLTSNKPSVLAGHGRAPVGATMTVCVSHMISSCGRPRIKPRSLATPLRPASKHFSSPIA